MGRALLIRSDFFPYHVSLRVNDRKPFPLPMDRVWEIFESEIFWIRIKFDVEIQAFVLMPNHFHMIITVPQYDLGIVMRTFLRNVTKSINREASRVGHLFGGPYHRLLIRTASYYYQALRYVYQNPLKAGLCDRVEDYPYSTYAGLLGLRPLRIAIHYTRAGFEYVLPGPEPIDWLEWLNLLPNPLITDILKILLRGGKAKVPLELVAE